MTFPNCSETLGTPCVLFIAVFIKFLTDNNKLMGYKKIILKRFLNAFLFQSNTNKVQ